MAKIRFGKSDNPNITIIHKSTHIIYRNIMILSLILNACFILYILHKQLI